MTDKLPPEWETIATEISELDEPLMICALRFDGYKYWESRCRHFDCTADDFTPVTEPVFERLELFPDDLDNLTAFFITQRFLGKWGGEACTPWSREHVAYRLLFLQCYRLAIPYEFMFEEYHTRWEREFGLSQELIAARVRKSFQTKGSGPTSWREVT